MKSFMQMYQHVFYEALGVFIKGSSLFSKVVVVLLLLSNLAQGIASFIFIPIVGYALACLAITLVELKTNSFNIKIKESKKDKDKN